MYLFDCGTVRLNLTNIQCNTSPSSSRGHGSSRPNTKLLHTSGSFHKILCNTALIILRNGAVCLCPSVRPSLCLSARLCSCLHSEYSISCWLYCRLDVFHRRCIRKILGLSRQDRVTNEELMRRSWMQTLSEIVTTRRLRLAGHVLRLPDVRPACVAMTWIPEAGRRTSGRPQMTWRASFMEDLHRINLTWHGARRAANGRHRWRNLVAQCPGRDRRN